MNSHQVNLGSDSVTPESLSYTPNAICPHCGHIERDSWEYDFGPGLDGDGEVMCNSCGEEFFCSRHVEVTYSTRPIAKATGA